jgi:protein-S-isoprenylcysteine O-methyltransferase Ste14
VGDVLILLAVAVFFSNPLGLAGVVVFVAWMNLFQIPAEERALKARFGEAFERYCERVRRWI